MSTITAKITIYEDSDFHGTSRELTESCNDLGTIGFNDRISSMKVVGSSWVAYEDTGYNGQQYILEEGEYKNNGAWKGWNDSLSSLKKLDVVVGEAPKITVYHDADFHGSSTTFEYAIDDLKYYGLNDSISSLKVEGGIWVLYEDASYCGQMYVVTKGSYANNAAWKGYNDSLSSLRPAKEPFFPTEVLSMEYDLDAGLLTSKPRALVSLTENNDSSKPQEPSWGISHTETTTKTFEWNWENALAVSSSCTFKTGVPIIANGQLTIGAEDTYTVGQGGGEANTSEDEWHFELPAVVAPHTQLHVEATIQDGKIDVPFHAELKKGNKQWTEAGTYYGTQSYNLVVDYKETPLTKKGGKK